MDLDERKQQGRRSCGRRLCKGRTIAGVPSDGRACLCEVDRYRFAMTAKSGDLFRMMYRTASVTARAIVVSVLGTVALAFAAGPHTFGQQPANPSVPLAQGPYSKKAQQAASFETVQIIFSPWTRYCAKGPTGQSAEIGTREVCFTAADGHLASGQKLVIALLIEPEG